MTRTITVALSVLAWTVLAPCVVSAQTAPPTYDGDPSVYKIIYEDQNLRLVEAHWKAGQTDKPHSHPASVAYAAQDCTVRLHLPDGTTRDISPKAGTRNGGRRYTLAHRRKSRRHRLSRALYRAQIIQPASVRVANSSRSASASATERSRTRQRPILPKRRLRSTTCPLRLATAK